MDYNDHGDNGDDDGDGGDDDGDDDDDNGNEDVQQQVSERGKEGTHDNLDKQENDVPR